MSDRTKRMEEALRKIIHARDYHADNAKYPLPPNGPDHGNQCFDDWAADVASEALSPWPRPEDMWLIDSGTGRIQSWDCEGNTRSGDDAHACALARQALTQDKWTHECFDRAEALSALELEIEDYNRVRDAMDALSESLNPIGNMT